MSDPGIRGMVRLSAGGIIGVKWRSTRSTEHTLHPYMCSLCRLIPKSTLLLPCCHVLCETCKNGSLQDGVSGVCPLDRELFDANVCPNIPLPPEGVERLKVYCWNEVHGCRFVGSMSSVLRHYEDECAFHAVECPRCGDTVQHKALVEHYTTACREIPGSPSTTNHSQPPDARVFRASDVSAALEELKRLQLEPYQNQLPAMESQVNRLTEDVTHHGIVLQAIVDTLKTMSERLISGRAQTSQEPSVVVTEQTRSQSKELHPQPGPGSNRAEVQQAGAILPWSLEKMHILRRLEVLASESLAYLGDVRQACVQHTERPIAQWEHVPGLRCPGFEKRDLLFSFRRRHGEGRCVTYRLSLKNVRGLCPSSLEEKTIFTVNKWHWKDAYLRVALVTSYPGFYLCFSFVGTFHKSCLASLVHSVDTWDEELRENVRLRALEDDVPLVVSGWEQVFAGHWRLLAQVASFDASEKNFDIVVVDT